MRNTCPGVRTADQFSSGATTTSCTTLFSTMSSLQAGAGRRGKQQTTLRPRKWATRLYADFRPKSTESPPGYSKLPDFNQKLPRKLRSTSAKEPMLSLQRHRLVAGLLISGGI